MHGDDNDQETRNTYFNNLEQQNEHQLYFVSLACKIRMTGEPSNLPPTHQNDMSFLINGFLQVDNRIEYVLPDP